MSNEVLNGVLGLLGLLITSFFGYLTARLNMKLNRIEEKSDKQEKRTEDIHILVNGTMTTVLTAIVLDKKRILGLVTPPNPADLEALHVAEKALVEHVARQSVVDEKALSNKKPE